MRKNILANKIAEMISADIVIQTREFLKFFQKVYPYRGNLWYTKRKIGVNAEW